MELASLGLGIRIFCDYLLSVLLLNAILGPDLLGLALSRAPGERAPRTSKCAFIADCPNRKIAEIKTAVKDF
jgi:hypothetical protein